MENSNDELEEVYIPEANNTADDDQLDDVIPCETSLFMGNQMMKVEENEQYDGLYDSNNFTSSVDLSKMVDIAPRTQQTSSEYSLEEVYIPEAQNTPDDDELDDVISA